MCIEGFAEKWLYIIVWFPIYYDVKTLVAIFMITPTTKAEGLSTNGSVLFYRTIVYPLFFKIGDEIEQIIDQFKREGLNPATACDHLSSLVKVTASWTRERFRNALEEKEKIMMEVK